MKDYSGEIESNMAENPEGILYLSGRPSLTHLNADTSWLLQFPLSPNSASDRQMFNLLIDPWFKGSQIDYVSWFSEQFHAIPSSVQSINNLETKLEKENTRTSPQISPGGPRSCSRRNRPYVDAIVISHEFTDHCNKQTLLEASPRIPIYATRAAASLIRSWSHFINVYEVPVVEEGSQNLWLTSCVHITPWLLASRVTSPKDMGCLHSGVLLAFPNVTVDEIADWEGILYTPHGIASGNAEWLTQLTPACNFLAVVHGLHEVSVTPMLQINLGAENGAKLSTVLKTRYWIVTHDEIKDGRGLIGRLLKRKEWNLNDALTFLSTLTSSIVPETTSKTGAMSEAKVQVLDSGEKYQLI